MATKTEHTDAEHAADAGHDDAHDHGLTDRGYVGIFVFLVVVTGAEVALSYMVDSLGWVFLPLLLGLMALKFFTVVTYFMHLRFDSWIFSFMFYTGLLLALGVYIATLLSFEFFSFK